MVTLAPCLSFSICALGGHSHWYTRPQVLSLISCPPCLGPAAGAGSTLVGPDSPSRRCWHEGPYCPGQIKEQRQELGQTRVWCLPQPGLKPRGCKGEGTHGSVRVCGWGGAPGTHLLSFHQQHSPGQAQGRGHVGKMARSRRGIL